MGQPPLGDPRRCGYNPDHRSDCVQEAIALVVTPEGFSLALVAGQPTTRKAT